MEWGVHLPQLGRTANREALVRFARRAEAPGCHSGWVSDHIAWPEAIASKYPYTEDGTFAPPPDMRWLDAFGTLFFVAACTERLRLGTTVLVLGYRPPVLTAKAVASLDLLSGGRAILGVGVGWMKEEFDVVGMPFDHRGARPMSSSSCSTPCSPTPTRAMKVATTGSPGSALSPSQCSAGFPSG